MSDLIKTVLSTDLSLKACKLSLCTNLQYTDEVLAVHLCTMKHKLTDVGSSRELTSWILDNHCKGYFIPDDETALKLGRDSLVVNMHIYIAGDEDTHNYARHASMQGLVNDAQAVAEKYDFDETYILEYCLEISKAMVSYKVLKQKAIRNQ